MNLELIHLYQDLTQTINLALPDSWESFKLSAEYDESGLGLSLEYSDTSSREIEVTPVPISIFPVMRRVYAEASPGHEWSEWVFEFNRNGKYSVNVKYPDSPPRT